MNARLADAAAIVFMVCSVAATGAFAVHELRAPRLRSTAAPDGAIRAVPNWRDYASGDRLFGDSSATVTIIEFGDYECPGCRQLAAAIDQLGRAQPKDLQVVYRHFPLTSIHPWARQAALAAECAGDQGQFMGMHHRLFQRQDSIGRLTWAQLADGVVRNGPALDSCVASERYKARVLSDIRAGRSLGLYATPSFLVNDSLYEGSRTASALERLVQAAVRRAAASKTTEFAR